MPSPTTRLPMLFAKVTVSGRVLAASVPMDEAYAGEMGCLGTTVRADGRRVRVWMAPGRGAVGGCARAALN